jgi:uncharacterized membrane protein
MSSEPRQPAGRKRRLERVAMGLMALGAAMMFQPFVIILFTYSFITFLAGTILFVVVSHFSE